MSPDFTLAVLENFKEKSLWPTVFISSQVVILVKTKEKYAEELIKFIEKPGNTKPVVTPKDKIVDLPEPFGPVKNAIGFTSMVSFQK